MNKFQLLDAKDLDENFFRLIGDDYTLITAKDNNKINAMTASWGFFGVMWHKNCICIVVRPSRFTYEFLKKNQKFTLNFLSDGCKEIYTFCGTRSGRDCDKIKETGLEVIEVGEGEISFSQSKYTFVCKTVYEQDMDKKGFNDVEFAQKMYPNGDVHTMFIAEIEKVYAKKS